MNNLLIPLAFAAGMALIALTLQDAFEVMLLPRRVLRRWRLMSFYFTCSWTLWTLIGRRMRDLEGRERFLSLFGPVSMVTMFAIWAAALVFGFGLIEWSLERVLPNHHSLGGYVYMSGVTFFTLGFGDYIPRTGATKAIAVVEAGTGLGLLALVIGYLPVLYQLFSSGKRMSCSSTAARALRPQQQRS